ncbi:hypothetical protein A8C56_22375 [Niabella ginsenosidivorans]|uniref:Polyketide cyclase n=1 Tax=Niabella ginsenosidivorans TaxID=1176587 RepID=A0A1A9I7Q7_9BACT|nr:SRPBCC family protein [Niabella ginsenosidivorans]ANH83365.1 hypothetical protein A8C56_22375 [Niabella ginsenosidivorans]
MRFFRWIFLFLICVAIVLLGLSFLAPVQQQVVRSVVINAPAKKVYEQMLLLQNFNNWSIWGKADSSIQYTSNRIPDGQVGTTITWNGNALLSGKGKIQLTGLLENRQITHHITLLEPQHLEADSKFDLTEQNNATSVTWTFTVPSERPWNVYNLFYSLDKEKGAEFEKGLQALKMMIEKAPIVPPNTPRIVNTNFSLTNYVSIRQQVRRADLPAFFTTHFHHLEHYTLKDSAATDVRTGLFYKKDEKALQDDVAAAIQIPAGFNPALRSPEELISIPASKAIEVRITGNNPATKDLAYKTLNDYIADRQLKTQAPVIEEYTAKDSTTRIIYLVE